MKPAGNGNKKRKNQWKKRRWQWKEACTLSWTRHSQKGGSNLLADPTLGPGLGVQPLADLPRDLAGETWEEAGSKIVFFLFFPRKKTKKEKQKNEKKRFGRTPPFQTRGSPQVSSHLHHLPGWSSQICKVSPKPSQSSCAQAPCHESEAYSFICKLQKWDDILSESDSKCFLVVFFHVFFPFFIAFLFVFLFFCFFFFWFFSKWLNRFFALEKMRFTELAWTVHHKTKRVSS